MRSVPHAPSATAWLALLLTVRRTRPDPREVISSLTNRTAAPGAARALPWHCDCRLVDEANAECSQFSWAQGTRQAEPAPHRRSPAMRPRSPSCRPPVLSNPRRGTHVLVELLVPRRWPTAVARLIGVGPASEADNFDSWRKGSRPEEVQRPRRHQRVLEARAPRRWPKRLVFDRPRDVGLAVGMGVEHPSRHGDGVARGCLQTAPARRLIVQSDSVRLSQL